MNHTEETKQRIRLWDVPTRLFHWLLVAAVVTAITTGLVGADWMDLHGMAGLAIVGLVVFRLVWGFVGNRHARFSSFVPSRAKLLSYLRGRWQGLGHNPLGAFSVLALLGLLSLQVGTGLFSNDEIAFSGPLASLVSEALSLRLTGLHRQLSTALFVLLGLHVVAILFHTWIKKDNLIQPMVTGFKDVKTSPANAASEPAGWTALICALVVAASAVYLASGALLPKTSAKAAAPAAQPTATPKPSW